MDIYLISGAWNALTIYWRDKTMGYSVVAGAGIIGMAIFISLEIFAGGIFPSFSDYENAYTLMTDRKIEQINSNITIVDVTVTAYDDNYNHSIIIENTGSITLPTNVFTIMLNGIVQTFNSSDVYIYPEKISYFNLSDIPGDGNQKLKVVSGKGINDYYEYII
jgi:archaellum component FlaF (FlaF/FlaG flagellin family)